MCCISKIQKNESNSQQNWSRLFRFSSCVVSQRYRKMKAIHNLTTFTIHYFEVVLYLKDTEKWKQFTTITVNFDSNSLLCCISKIQKNESNSQQARNICKMAFSCVVSQRYRKMKAIHNLFSVRIFIFLVVLYLKDTEKWKQFTTEWKPGTTWRSLCCISKIQKNESNSQQQMLMLPILHSCVVSQRYRKMKAIHNLN